MRNCQKLALIICILSVYLGAVKCCFGFKGCFGGGKRGRVKPISSNSIHINQCLSGICQYKDLTDILSTIHDVRLENSIVYLKFFYRTYEETLKGEGKKNMASCELIELNKTNSNDSDEVRAFDRILSTFFKA